MAYDDVYAELVARNYDASYAVLRDASGDIAFYRQLAGEFGGPVLELGCGTGRTLLPIARDGIECVGLDASLPMLEVFRSKSPPANLTLVHGRMEEFELGDARFALITCPFRALSHLLEVQAQLAMLRRVRRHLAPGGVFAFDVFDPKLANMAVTREPERLAATFHDRGQPVRRWDSVERDATTQLMRVHWRFEGGPPELSGKVEFQMRWFYRFELEHLLARAGFADTEFYAGFTRERWVADHDTVVLARPG